MSRLIRFRELHFLGLGTIYSMLITGIFAVYLYRFGGTVAVDRILQDNRTAVYGTLAGISGSLLGFVITALSIIIGYSTNAKFDFLKKTAHYKTLWAVLMKTIWALSLATGYMIIGLVFDRDNSTHDIILCFSIYPLALVFFRLKRCIWVIEKVIEIIT